MHRVIRKDHRPARLAVVVAGTLLTIGCSGTQGTEAVEASSAATAPLLLRTERQTDPDDRIAVVAPEASSRLRAVIEPGATARASSVAARWRSSDTSVVRVAAVDSVAIVTFLAAGSAVVTAEYASDATTWRGAIRFRVVQRAP